MKIENTIAQMRKGILEMCILEIIDSQESYPSEIIKELKAVDLIIVEGTLYPLLTRLKNGDLLKYRWEESTSGPPRKYYTLTKKGSQFLEKLKSHWSSITTAVSSLSKNQHVHEKDN